jgi:hypothetical protein
MIEILGNVYHGTSIFKLSSAENLNVELKEASRTLGF